MGMVKNEELLHLFREIDSQRSTDEKLEQFRKWIQSVPDVQGVKILSFEKTDFAGNSDITLSLPSGNTSLFPNEPAILNGRSPLPQGLFPACEGGNLTLYYPFFRTGREPVGAILLRCENPKKFLSRNNTELGIIASKLTDTVYAGVLKSRLRDIRKSGGGSENLSPEHVGNLMGMLDLPMYVSDHTGRFISVNDQFLKSFSYESIEKIGSTADFFIEEDEWNNGIKKIFGTDKATGFTVRVRTGRGETRVVQDAATLIGRYTFGVLFDITEYVRINEALQDSLDEQKSLNERLLSTSTVLQKTQTTAMKSLAMLAEYRDMETGNHLHRICEYNRRMCEIIHEKQPYCFHISEEYIEDIYLSGMLHDIGKVGVPDSILLKNGTLSTQEWDVMRKHTIWGWDILHQADKELGEQSFLTLAARIALSHHEKYDGNGYPRNLKSEEIPLSARISSISDVYDALTSRRPYKEAWSHEQAAEEIVGQKGLQFDPILIEIFEDLEEDFQRIKQEFPDERVHLN